MFSLWKHGDEMDFTWGLEFDLSQIYQMIYYGIYGETGGAVYLQFACYVAAMGHHGMYGKKKSVGDFFVGHAFHHKCNYLFLSGT